MTSVTPDPKRNRKVGLMAGGLALAMLGLGWASVPLYRMFCQVTGFGGTTQRITEEQASAVSVSARTNARAASGRSRTISQEICCSSLLPWISTAKSAPKSRPTR